MKKTLLLLLTCTVLSSCNFIMDSLFHPYSRPSDFEYYKKNYQLGASENLNTNSFYYTQGVGVSGGYYLYLKFFDDGGVYYFGGTSMQPKEIANGNFMDLERKRNGIPEDRKASWGYYQCHGNKIACTIKDYGAMSSKMLKYKGFVKEDTLTLKFYTKTVNDSTYHFFSNEKFHLYMP